MQCKNCGNEVNDGENFCRECGTRANEVYRGNTIETKKKIKNPFIIGIIILIVFIFAMSMVKVLFNFHEDITLEEGANNTVEIPTKDDKNNVLDVIDQENQEFKINAEELAKAIIEAKDKKDIQERSILKLHLIYNVEKEIEQRTGKNVNVYTLKYEGFDESIWLSPFMLIANADTNNVYRIFVCHPFLNGYGTELNSDAMDNNYEILGMALIKLNQQELYKTILEIGNEVSKSPSGVSQDWNIKGVHVGASEGTINKYGNLSSIYYFYATR